ncbi:MAG: 3-hydroxyacyl-CoA dehydrogenase family protein [Deltaproteobacteria bacterium]|nr:MAG: 3-hydroxyacyl-CoA dehydrogenase family protein [Deltaproteobacteria bacterium]
MAKFDTITVLGAGTMGHGIAQVAAAKGRNVFLYDIDTGILDRAMERITGSLEKLASKGKLEEPVDSITGRISTTTDIEHACQAADLVVEAVPELMELKKEIFAQVDACSPPHAILASNTSQLSVTALAAATKRPDRVLGMHWFNPPPLMKLIEIVRAVQTSDETLQAIVGLSRELGKTPVVCRDAQGFITTRALTAFLVECYRIYEEGVASAEDIDEAIRLGLNHPMGPLQLSDFVGLDVIAHICDALVDAYGDRFRPPQTLVNLVRAGRHGVKAGAGFYGYEK